MKASLALAFFMRCRLASTGPQRGSHMSLFNSVFDAHKQKLESQQANDLQSQALEARPREALRKGFLDVAQTQVRPLFQEVCRDATERGFHASVDDELSDHNAPWI